jgi:flagellar basal-body rod protein FlgB
MHYVWPRLVSFVQACSYNSINEGCKASMTGIFSIALDRTRWLGVRQARIAENISNVNTPGYKAKDVVAFRELVSGMALTMQATHQDHIGVTQVATAPVRGASVDGTQTISGNSVDLDSELLKLSENARSYALATGIARNFHRMYLNSVRAVG